jgi:Secretion system C-terminal sorting domain
MHHRISTCRCQVRTGRIAMSELRLPAILLRCSPGSASISTAGFYLCSVTDVTHGVVPAGCRLESGGHPYGWAANGPVVLGHVSLSRSRVFPDIYTLVPSFRNNGSSQSVSNLTASLQSHDSCVIEMAPASYTIPSISAGAVDSSGYLEIRVDTTKFPRFHQPELVDRRRRMATWEDSARATVTGVEFVGNVPTRFALEQNYPNPCNPISEIRYQISEIRYVRLAVYDLLGREVAVLVNEKKAPGTYTAQFDASGLASGVYLYRLQAGSFVDVRKMVVLR